MPKKAKNTTGDNSEHFETDYNNIVNKDFFTIQVMPQWIKTGDVFEKFTMYQEYTSIQTSGGTTLLCNI